MARRLDQGDQFPSDVGDVAPFNLANNVGHVAGNPRNLKLGDVTRRPIPQQIYDVNLPPDKTEVNRASAWVGTVRTVGEHDGLYRIYTVVRADGRILEARAIEHAQAPALEIDESIIITEGEGENNFFISGRRSSTDPEHYFVQLSQALAAGSPLSMASAQGVLYFFSGSTFQTVNQVVTVYNPYDNAFDPGTFVPIERLNTNRRYIVKFIDTGDGEGGGGGTETLNVIRFTLNEDLFLSDTSAQATINHSTAGSTGIVTVHDQEAKYLAYAGYRGYAYFNGTQFCIFELEGPARFAKFEAIADSGIDDATVTADILEWWGSPTNGILIDGTGIVVNKLSGYKIPIYDGDQFIGVFDEVAREWLLIWYPGLRLTVRGSINLNVTEDDDFFTLYNLELINGWVLPIGQILVTNDPDIWAESGEIVEARFNVTISTNPSQAWDTGTGGNVLHHVRGLGSYDKTKQQIIWQNANNDPEWTETAESPIVTEITSLVNSGSDLILNYKSATIKVIATTTPMAASVSVPLTSNCPEPPPP